MKKFYPLAKHFEDFVLSLTAILTLLPLMLFIALFLRLSGVKPVIFKQARAGLCGKIFTIYKFRTMTNATGLDGKLLPDRQRLTKLGSFLRKLSLDELLQFYNVLKGDMSLVGPRPLLPEYVPLYSEKHRRRLSVKPGITGLVQVSGRSSIKWSCKFDIDVEYVQKKSLWLDNVILFKTVFKVFIAKDSPDVPECIENLDDLGFLERLKK